MNNIDPQDIARVREFQQWVKDTREAKGITYQEAADRFNAMKSPNDPSWSISALRRLEDRPLELSTVTRTTCRRVALALDVDTNVVLMKAGYLPSDDYLQVDELPMDTRREYSFLTEDDKQDVAEYIHNLYVSRLGVSNEKILSGS